MEKFVLMLKNEEILLFEVAFGEKIHAEFIEGLSAFTKAPVGIANETDPQERDFALIKFLNSRCISPNRWDYFEILKRTKSISGLELSFKGHGLSLSDHYWYKRVDEDLRYEDINFFENGFDDSFGKAILRSDYESLEEVNLNVPDVTTPGWAAKAWINEEDGPYLWKLGIHKGHGEESLGEVLASHLARRLFGEDEVLHYELKEANGQFASVSKCLVNIDEELIPLAHALPEHIVELSLMDKKNRDHVDTLLNALREGGFEDVYQIYVKMMCLRTLAFVNDFHFNNISMIRNLSTGRSRVAPIYDLAGAFGGTEKGRQFLSKLDKGSLLLVYFAYGMLDEKWDYSWYDPQKIEGFEDEIREYLSESDFYSEELIDIILGVYRHQKKSLDNMAEKAKRG